MKDYLTHPLSGAMAAAGTVASIFNLEAIVVLVAWGWTNLGQIFYMVTLLVSSSTILPISQAMAAKLVGGVAFLLLLKLSWEARKKIAARTD